MISIIVACDKNRAIGKNNDLLWHISEDLQRFKKLTSGHPVIMGQKTYESIGRPLPDRTNIVLTKDLDLKIPGCIICFSPEEAIEEAYKHREEVFICGGGQIYNLFIDKADKLYLTLVDAEFEADTFFPDYSAFNKETLREDHETEDGLKYSFLELEK